jgi:putative nucleotidyltransferase with HDIG domain
VPAFPAVAMKLLSLLSEENSSFSVVAACIATDPILSGQLIKRANAADQASYCDTRTVLQAVSVLGLDCSREFSLTMATMGYARSAAKTEILRPCWHHTLACALIASDLARQAGLRPAEAYTAALLHDIGRLGLLAAYPAEYETILAGPPEDLLQSELAIFGVDHVAAGEWLAREWQLPESIVDVIVTQHQPTTDGPLDLAGVVRITCGLADLLGFGVNASVSPPSFEQITAPLPAWIASRLAPQLPLLQAAITAEIQRFDILEAPAKASTEEAVEAAEESVEIPPSSVPTGHSRGWLIGAAVAGVSLLAAATRLWWR